MSQTPHVTPVPNRQAPVCREVAVLSLERHLPPNASTPEANLYSLRLHSPGWECWLPGQFVMLRPKRAGDDTLWARPFSISRADEKELVIVFQVVGRGTKALVDLSPGELITLWGPLGNAFAVSPHAPTLLLAGGIGIAPFVGYIEHHPNPHNLRMHFGHRLPLECYPFENCSSASGRAIDACNHLDCGPGDLERFLNILDTEIQNISLRNGLVLACGPMPFLRAIQKFALRYKVPAQLSLETRMACGVGACLGCVVKSTAQTECGSACEKVDTPPTPGAFAYVQTCTCGPVFWADHIILDE